MSNPKKILIAVLFIVYIISIVFVSFIPNISEDLEIYEYIIYPYMIINVFIVVFLFSAIVVFGDDKDGDYCKFCKAKNYINVLLFLISISTGLLILGNDYKNSLEHREVDDAITLVQDLTPFRKDTRVSYSCTKHKQFHVSDIGGYWDNLDTLIKYNYTRSYEVYDSQGDYIGHYHKIFRK